MKFVNAIYSCDDKSQNTSYNYEQLTVNYKKPMYVIDIVITFRVILTFSKTNSNFRYTIYKTLNNEIKCTIKHEKLEDVVEEFKRQFLY